MNFFDSVRTSLSNLRRHKLRSGLTMLGVIIGVAAVILMVSLVEGARANVVREFERLGSSLIFVGFDPSKLPPGQTIGRVNGLRLEDAEAMLEQCPSVAAVSAELGIGTGKTRTPGKEMDASVLGVQPVYQKLRDVTLERGRFITDEDLATWSRSAVIGSEVAVRLFGKQNPIGQAIDFRGLTLNVVGVTKAKGRGMGENVDEQILIPLSSAQKRAAGINLVSMIFATPVSADKTDLAMDEIWQLLMRRYDNKPAFIVDSQQRILSSIGRVISIFGTVVGAIAGLSLLVGGIGIMNIMLVTVTERTREIGIRKAVGARQGDILWQFLIESMTLSGVGGVIGVALGWGLALMVNFLTKAFGTFGGDGMSISLPVWAAATGFVFSMVVGVGFGLYPAISASRMNPIQALRTE